MKQKTNETIDRASREQAAVWFMSLTYLEQHALSDKYFESRNPSILTIEQVVEIYIKENKNNFHQKKKSITKIILDLTVIILLFLIGGYLVFLNANILSEYEWTWSNNILIKSAQKFLDALWIISTVLSVAVYIFIIVFFINKKFNTISDGYYQR